MNIEIYKSNLPLSKKYIDQMQYASVNVLINGKVLGFIQYSQVIQFVLIEYNNDVYKIFFKYNDNGTISQRWPKSFYIHYISEDFSLERILQLYKTIVSTALKTHIYY